VDSLDPFTIRNTPALVDADGVYFAVSVFDERQFRRKGAGMENGLRVRKDFKRGLTRGLRHEFVAFTKDTQHEAWSNLVFAHIALQHLRVDGEAGHTRGGEEPDFVGIEEPVAVSIAAQIARDEVIGSRCGAAIINQRFAALHFPGTDPIGRRIKLSIDLQGGAAPQGGIPLSLTASIVGIVPNLRQRDVNLPDPDPIAYLPFRMDPRGFMNLIVRSAGDPNQMTPLLREEVRAIDADLPLFGIRTMDDQLAQAGKRFFGPPQLDFDGIEGGLRHGNDPK